MAKRLLTVTLAIMLVFVFTAITSSAATVSGTIKFDFVWDGTEAPCPACDCSYVIRVGGVRVQTQTGDEGPEVDSPDFSITSIKIFSGSTLVADLFANGAAEEYATTGEAGGADEDAGVADWLKNSGSASIDWVGGAIEFTDRPNTYSAVDVRFENLDAGSYTLEVVVKGAVGTVVVFDRATGPWRSSGDPEFAILELAAAPPANNNNNNNTNEGGGVDGDKKDVETGIGDVAVASAIALVAVGAVVVSRKRK
jgi:type 1 fimbria pilin